MTNGAESDSKSCGVVVCRRHTKEKFQDFEKALFLTETERATRTNVCEFAQKTQSPFTKIYEGVQRSHICGFCPE